MFDQRHEAGSQVASGDEGPTTISGRRVAFAGKLAGMNRREAQELVRQHGAMPVERLDDDPQIVVVGEAELPLGDVADWFERHERCRQAAERGDCTVITETQLWQQLGFVEGQRNVHRLYTPAMLADLLGVPVSVVRRWHRRGLIVPAREVRRLPYFDFQEVATARRLAELMAAGNSPQQIEKKLAGISRLVPGVDRPLAQLSVLIEGKQLLLRQGDGLIEPGGQYRFDFEAPLASECPPAALQFTVRSSVAGEDPSMSPEELCAWAAQKDDEGQLDVAAELYRAALVAGGPNAETCFALAELLYRLGDLPAARERYYMAIELDENYVEARANLGCVLAETGQQELAVAAFEGALAYHRDYPDVHYHLARTLDDLGRRDEADLHWRIFVELSADSPWATAALERLGLQTVED
ncbi:MAG TPA: MerR family transcriptional regulator [Pirellulales bacterium]|nr:MerR family transcriptional regulator [Pirellulales bacterium]